MQRTVLSLLGVAIILGSSVAHGLWTLRWTGVRLLEAAGAQVPLIPKEFGDWTSEEIKVNKRQMDQAGAYGYFSRRYVNRTSGQALVVMFLCGQSGPIAAHTPTICFPGSGMELMAPEKRYSPRRDESSSWGDVYWADFKGNISGHPSRVRLFWAWSANGYTWQAPEYPRVALAGKPYLFKIFVHRELDQLDSKESKPASLDGDPCVEFLREFLPEVKKTVRAGSLHEKSSEET